MPALHTRVLGFNFWLLLLTVALYPSFLLVQNLIVMVTQVTGILLPL